MSNIYKSEIRIILPNSLDTWIHSLKYKVEVFSKHSYLDIFYIPEFIQSEKILESWNPSRRALRIRTSSEDSKKVDIVFSLTKIIKTPESNINVKLNLLDYKDDKLSLVSNVSPKFAKSLVRGMGFKKWFSLFKKDGRAIRIFFHDLNQELVLYCEEIHSNYNGKTSIIYTAELELFGESFEALNKQFESNIFLLKLLGINRKNMPGFSLPEIVIRNV